MKLYIEIDDVTGTVTRINCHTKSERGLPVGVDAQATADTPVEVPAQLVPAVVWAQSAIAAAKESHVENTLREFAGVSADKLAAVKAAIEAEKVK